MSSVPAYMVLLMTGDPIRSRITENVKHGTVTRQQSAFPEVLFYSFTSLLALFVFVCDVGFSSQARYGKEWNIDGYSGFIALSMIAAALGAASLYFRRSLPQIAFWWGCVTALLLGSTSLVALVSYPLMTVKSSRRVVALASVALSLVVLHVFWSDYRRPYERKIFVTDDGAELHATGALVTTAVVLIILFSIAYARNNRKHLSSAQTEALRQKEAAVGLQNELMRTRERELIAREVHDTVAHHMSLVALQASALEVSGHDSDTTASAQAIRLHAHRATDDLRVLLQSIRDPLNRVYLESPATWGDIAGSIQRARAAGVDVVDDIKVSHESRASATLIQATARIVQESLTNAIRYKGPGPIAVEVMAAPEYGVHIRVENTVANDGPDAPSVGSGSGLEAMRARALALGGALGAGREGDKWLVRGFLHWHGEDDPTHVEGHGS